MAVFESLPLNFLVNVALIYFFGQVFVISAINGSMFTKVYARRHRVCGAALFSWLVLGFVDISVGPMIPTITYDTILGMLGTATALTAAFDFKKAHSHVTNPASGTLDEDATVTFDEMIEHSFYQLLNLVQILYLHALEAYPSANIYQRAALAVCATLPWGARGFFPVNSFSDNYNKGQQVVSLISILYRLKKYQYIFYKHFLLHGLNISLALHGDVQLVSLGYFRLYWLCLNTSYVMEFFLQTLVKKRYMQQTLMLVLQQVLMGVSTVAAVGVLAHVNVWLAFLSLLLNFTNRKKEIANMLLMITAYAAYVTLKHD